MKIDLNKLENITFDGVDSRQHPEYEDVFIDHAEINGVELTDKEYDEVNENYEFVYEKFIEQLY